MKPIYLCLTLSLLFAVTAYTTENTNHTLISGSFGVAWIDGDGIIRLYDGESVTTPVPGVKVHAILATDLLEEGSDQLIYLDDARKSLHIHSFETGTTIGPFGHDVRTMAAGRASANETFPSLLVSTFSGSAFRWTKEIMGGAWHPVPGAFSHISRGRFDLRSDLDGFAVVSDGNVFIYSPRWQTYSRAVEGKNIVAVLTGNFTTAPGDEIAMLDRDGNIFLYSGRTLEDLGREAVHLAEATCLAVKRNPEGLDTLFVLDRLGNSGHYNRETKTWTMYGAIGLGSSRVPHVSNIIAKDNESVFALLSGNLYEISEENFRQLSWLPSPAATTHSLQISGKTLARYRFGNVPFKPYIDELRTPSGKNILRDAPWDYLHHHALMYALRVGDYSFWGEAADNGKQITIQFRSGSNFVESELDWNTPDSNTVLNEVRRITVDQGDNVTLLDWQSALTPTIDTVLGGDHYYGLGMRFLEEMDNDGRFFSDAGAHDREIVRGDERLTRCRWMAYTAKVDGQPVTVALFDHPSNPIPMTAFTMGDAGGPFAYLSATMNLHREPVELKAGETFAIKYRVAVWDGEISPETVEGKYREFVR